MNALFIDGMTSPKIIWNALAIPMQAKYKFNATYSEWYNWQKHVYTDWDIIASHSLGADSAIQLCLWLREQKRPQPKALITLGARHQSAASWFDWLLPVSPVQKFTAPNAVTYNFWTMGPLPSAPIDGAVENVRIGLPYWHGTIPAAPEVHACFAKLIGDLDSKQESK